MKSLPSAGRFLLTGVRTPRNVLYMETKTKTPGYNTRLEIFFQLDKNGRKVAYRFSRMQFRSFRMSLADAEMFIATDQATLIPGNPMKPVARPALTVVR